MIHKYYAKNKRIIFPWVEDWTSPHNEIRHSNNIKAMDFNKWFFFHPSAYKIVFYGFNLVGAATFGLFALFFNLKGMTLSWSICLLLAGYLLYNFVKKFKESRSIKDITMYDLYMREFDDENT